MSTRTRSFCQRAVLAAMFIFSGAVLAAETPSPAPARAALTVNVVQPRLDVLPLRVTANGNIAAWQEAVIGTESNGLRLDDVHVNVGSVVKRGQVLATFAADTVQAALAESRANVAEAQARHAEAVANVERHRDLLAKGFISPQKLNEYVTAEHTAAARLDAQKALFKANQLRLGQTRVLAPDDGTISARNATVGAVLPAGQELFRLIRGGRLEWRAEVAAADLARLRAGMLATVTPAGGEPVAGKVRVLAPTVDPQTRNGMVYVDLPQPGTARAGMFAQGSFEIGSSKAWTLPQSAVVLRDGFSFAMRVDKEGRISVAKVAVGRRVADRVEIVSGLDAEARVVASGGAFLADGDTVRVVDAAVAKP
ncbi:MAG TPA: efflux RND transporter periplasmic adaptor subunit [Macromonas sp.]|nr:efflux RND transporter periplasmic adaptor subunit [Macromonas sp.]